MFSGFGGVFGGGFGIPAASNKFEEHFRCYPVSMMGDGIRKDDANFGGKIFLPSSALNKLTMLHIRYPMLFELTNEATNTRTHSGVLEFVAEEGRAYIPQWMMETLGLNPGQIVKIANCDLPLGRFVKIEPQSVDFLDISDPKAVLENVLRKFSTLTVNDVIEINYNDQSYGIKVLEVKPDESSHGICVVETDLETDFAPPVGYVEPDYKSTSVSKSATPAPIDPSKVNRGAGAATMAKSINYANLVSNGNKFSGSGQKLSGKAVDPNQGKKVSVDDLDPDAPAVPLDLPPNQLFFGFPVVLPTPSPTDDEQPQATRRFEGSGQSLRQSRKRKGQNDNLPSPKAQKSPPEYIEID